MNVRTDLAMEQTATMTEGLQGIVIEQEQQCGAEITRVEIVSREASERIGKPRGHYWTLCHPNLAQMEPDERIKIAHLVAETLKMMLPSKGSVLVLGLGNRRMTADALGPRVVDGVMVTRHLNIRTMRPVSALAPGVLGITGIETAELAVSLAEQLRPEAILVIDALAAMETSHICTTIQVTDTGIHPGSGVGNHRQGITKETMHVPVIAMGIPMVVYASIIVRDALRKLIATERSSEDADMMAEELVSNMPGEMVVTPRDIDEIVAGLGDLLALAINAALQPSMGMEELSLYLH